MGPLGWIGLGAVALFLLGRSSGSGPGKIDGAVILDGVDGDDYGMTVDAVTAKVSPFDQKSLFVFYNNSEGASDPALRARLTESAREAGIKGIVHVYGPAADYPAVRLYNRGVLEKEFDGSSWDDAVAWVDELSTAQVGRQVGAIVGNQHMAGMTRSRYDHAAPKQKAITSGGKLRVAEMITKIKKGAQVEMKEHGIPYSQAKRIAEDHLKRDPGYYDR